MSAFAKSTFNAARYAAIRPTYPPQLFDYAFDYHASGPNPARWDLAVDLGCGTGQATTHLSPFKKVIGVDPSTKMIEQAAQLLAQAQPPPPNEISFQKGSAEDLSFLAPHSVDMVMACQAAHWFKYPDIYASLAQVLRPKSGTFFFSGYSMFLAAKHPYLTPLIYQYQGFDESTTLGKYWEAGRGILDNHFFDVPPPKEEDGWTNWRHVLFVGDHYPQLLNKGYDTRPAILRKQFTWQQLEAYLRTASSLHTYFEKNPDDEAKKAEIKDDTYEEDKGDVAQRFLGRLRRKIREETGKVESEIEIVWPMAFVMGRRK